MPTHQSPEEKDEPPSEKNGAEAPVVKMVGADHGGVVNVNHFSPDVWVLRLFIALCLVLVLLLGGTYVSLVLRGVEVPVSLTSLLSAVVGAILGLLTPHNIPPAPNQPPQGQRMGLALAT